MLAVRQCPICQGKNFSPYLSCIDYTVSHETFQLVVCDACGLLITSPRPDDDKLAQYYLSDDYISHSNKSSSLVDKIYKISRSFALTWKINLVKSYLKQRSATTRKLLDFGCGTGAFLQKARQEGLFINGVEPSEVARKLATTITGIPILPDIQGIQETFDVITLWHVLEHIPDLNQMLKELASKLSKNGIIFIAVPNYQSLDSKIYNKHWAGYDVPRHLWHFNQATMKALLKNHSLHVEKVIPMKLDAFYVSLLSEKYFSKRTGLGGMIRAFLNGMRSNYKARKNKEYSSLIYIAYK